MFLEAIRVPGTWYLVSQGRITLVQVGAYLIVLGARGEK